MSDLQMAQSLAAAQPAGPTDCSDADANDLQPGAPPQELPVRSHSATTSLSVCPCTCALFLGRDVLLVQAVAACTERTQYRGRTPTRSSQVHLLNMTVCLAMLQGESITLQEEEAAQQQQPRERLSGFSLTVDSGCPSMVRVPSSRPLCPPRPWISDHCYTTSSLIDHCTAYPAGLHSAC